MRLAQRARTGAAVRSPVPNRTAVEALEPGAGDAPHTLRLEGGNCVRGRAVVIATGASYRRIGVEAIEEFVGQE
jgi:thioredoxin reductase (NADPH)